jgi:hypothetical protein
LGRERAEVGSRLSILYERWESLVGAQSASLEIDEEDA